MDLGALRKITLRAAQKIYPRLGLRDSDIILASFPKSGNTWMRFIWANMISLMEFEGREIDFRFLDTEMAIVYDSPFQRTVEFNCLPRLVKTHRLYNPRAFEKNQVIYVVRHPGDVAVSHFEYRKAEKNGINISNLKRFIRDPEIGISSWCEHVLSWHLKADAVVRYEDLKSSAVETVRRTLKELNLNHIPDPIIKQAVSRSSFDKMKNIEEEKGRVRESDFESEYQFMRSGRMGEWKEAFEKDDIQYMRTTVKKSGLEKIYEI